MAYLKGARAWREVGATLWLMLLGVGLLATSPEGRPSANNYYHGHLWTGGSVVTLSDAEPRRAFSVTVLARKGVKGSIPEFATLSLSAGIESTGSNLTDGGGGQ